MDFDEAKVGFSFDDINIHKPSGIECISSRVMKDVLKMLTPQMYHIYRESIATGTFPVSWATAKVTVIPKGMKSLDVVTNFYSANTV